MSESQLWLPQRQAQLSVQEENLLGKSGDRLGTQRQQARRQLRGLK